MHTADLDQLLSNATDLARAVLRWWVGELWGMLPSRLAALAQRSRARILLEVHGGDIVAAWEVGTERIELARIHADSQDHDMAQGALAAALRRVRRTSITTVLRLPTAQILRRKISLPLAAAKSLRQVLAHEFDRQMPLSRDQAYFDCRVLHRDRGKKQLTAELITVRRGVIDRGIELANSCGLRLTQIELIGDGDPVRLPGLLQPEDSATRRRWEWRVSAALVGLGFIFIVGTCTALVDRQQNYDDAIAQALAAAKSRADAAKQLQAKVHAIAESQRFLPLQKRAASVMTVLNEVTRILPDNIWLFDLELRGKEVRLHGFAPAASSLLVLFAQSPLFENARFRAPLTQGQHGSVERFDLSMDFKGVP
jgi:general secretion pathway protein L